MKPQDPAVVRHATELLDHGHTVIPDDQNFRAKVVQAANGMAGGYITGRYVSYFDPQLKKIVIALHWKLRHLLGLDPEPLVRR
jgi:hypothetical protein